VLGVQAARQTPAAAALPGAVVTDDLTPFGFEPIKTARALCPPNTHVTGGGGRIIGAGGLAVLTRLQPIRTNNQDRYEVTAIDADGDVTTSWAVQAYAICADIAAPEIRSATAADGGRSFQDATAGCPGGAGSVTGGGGQISGGKGRVSLAAVAQSVSISSMRSRGLEDPITGFSEPWSVTSYAVCTAPETARAGSTRVSPIDSNQKILPVPCQPGGTVTGGGAMLSDVSFNAPPIVLEAIVPEILPGAVPGDQIQVIARESTPTNATWSLRGTVTCAR